MIAVRVQQTHRPPLLIAVAKCGNGLEPLGAYGLRDVYCERHLRKTSSGKQSASSQQQNLLYPAADVATGHRRKSCPHRATELPLWTMHGGLLRQITTFSIFERTMSSTLPARMADIAYAEARQM